jgi:hypothetical protein
VAALEPAIGAPDGDGVRVVAVVGFTDKADRTLGRERRGRAVRVVADPGEDLLDGTGQPERWTYDVETDTWALIDQANGPEWHAVLAYDASVDRIIAPGGGATGRPTWLFDIRTRTWSRSGVETPVVEPNWAVPTVTYDEAAERTVIAGSAGWAAYDATADRWEVLAGPGGSFANPMAYDPVNRRLIGVGQGGIAVQGDVVAFDLATREWTVLLEPSPPVPPEVSPSPGQ